METWRKWKIPVRKNSRERKAVQHSLRWLEMRASCRHRRSNEATHSHEPVFLDTRDSWGAIGKASIHQAIEAALWIPHDNVLCNISRVGDKAAAAAGRRLTKWRQEGAARPKVQIPRKWKNSFRNTRIHESGIRIHGNQYFFLKNQKFRSRDQRDGVWTLKPKFPYLLLPKWQVGCWQRLWTTWLHCFSDKNNRLGPSAIYQLMYVWDWKSVVMSKSFFHPNP